MRVAKERLHAHVLLVRVGGGLVFVVVVVVVVGRRCLVVVVVVVVVARGRPREALEDGLLVVLLRIVVRTAERVGGAGACAGSRRVAAARGSRPAGRGAPRVSAL